MEDTLGELITIMKIIHPSLNPCFNGRYSRSLIITFTLSTITSVLILVLMEDTLGDLIIYDYGKEECVLILVLMEDTLGV